MYLCQSFMRLFCQTCLSFHPPPNSDLWPPIMSSSCNSLPTEYLHKSIYYFALYLHRHLRKCPLMYAVLCIIMHHNIFRVLIMLVIYCPSPPQVSAGVGSPLVSSTSNQANSCSNHCSRSVFSRAWNEGWLKSPTTAFTLKYHNWRAALRHKANQHAP